MLNKELCKRCINERYYPNCGAWGEDDEEIWVKGFVDCGIGGGSSPKPIVNGVPKGCYYALEQTVLNQEPQSC